MNPASEPEATATGDRLKLNSHFSWRRLERLQSADAGRAAASMASASLRLRIHADCGRISDPSCDGLLILLAPAAIFVVLAVLQEKVLESHPLSHAGHSFYEDGTGTVERCMARPRRDWRAVPRCRASLCARPRCLLETRRLFQYLSTARTRAGEETLAKWLLEAAPVEVILARQAAVRGLPSRRQVSREHRLGRRTGAHRRPSGSVGPWGSEVIAHINCDSDR